MSTHAPGFHFSGFLHHSVLVKLGTTSIRVNCSLLSLVDVMLPNVGAGKINILKYQQE